jgi:hypothetical protein
VLVIALAILLLAAPALGKGYVQKTEHGTIDWFSGLVSAEGVGGSPEADLSERAAERLSLREALLQARGELWKTVQSVLVSRGTRLGDILSDREDIAERVRGLVHTAPILERERLSQGRLRVRVGLRLRDRLAKDIIPDTAWFDDQGQAQPGGESGQPSQARRFTGMVVDAKGLDIQPALLVKIYSGSGRLLYGPSLANPEVALEQGLIQYVDALSSAVKSERVGKKPLIVQASGVHEGSECDLVLQDKKAELLRAALGRKDFLKACKVVIILDDGGQAGMEEYEIQ